MKTTLILIIVVALAGCSEVTVKPSGEVTYKGPRKVSIATPKAVVETGEIGLSQESVQILGKQGRIMYLDSPPKDDEKDK